MATSETNNTSESLANAVAEAVECPNCDEVFDHDLTNLVMRYLACHCRWEGIPLKLEGDA